MELRRELRLMVGALISLNLLLALGAIGLFMRMGPAIERILQENVYSIVAAEDLLTELADAGGEALDDDARERARRALDKATQNVTEKEELPVLESIERDLPAAMDGRTDARQRAVASIRLLIQINRRAMGKVDEEARRLGTAGAWAAVFVGFASFLLTISILGRFKNRFIRPLVDLFEVLESHRHGERLRRCRPSDAPREIAQITRLVNRLLDERLAQDQLFRDTGRDERDKQDRDDSELEEQAGARDAR